MGQIATCKYICDTLKARRPSPFFVPFPGTENNAATTKYLLETVDRYNEYITGQSTEFGTSEYATNQIVDTIAVDNTMNLLWGNGGKFVALGQIGSAQPIGRSAYSFDGINWTEGGRFSYRPGPIAYGKGIYVGIMRHDYGTGEIYSTDGINWTVASGVGFDSSSTAIAYGAGKFVVASSVGVYYSTNGLNWTFSILPSGVDLSNKMITYGKGRFVIIGSGYYSSVPTYFLYSYDGINWTRGRDLPAAYYRYIDVIYGGNQFVAIGAGNLAYSSDGFNWLKGNPPTSPTMSFSIDLLSYGNGRFVGIGAASSYSNNGMYWTPPVGLPGGGTFNCSSFTYGKGRFVGVNQNTGTNPFISTPDGINWTVGTFPINVSWNGVCYGSY